MTLHRRCELNDIVRRLHGGSRASSCSIVSAHELANHRGPPRCFLKNVAAISTVSSHHGWLIQKGCGASLSVDTAVLMPSARSFSIISGRPILSVSFSPSMKIGGGNPARRSEERRVGKE